LLELVYLVTFNILLNTTFVQKQANMIQPEKFQIQWESAWTLYPSRVHIEKLTARGGSGSQEWQADVDSASASISLFSLMSHKVKVCGIELNNITYVESPSEQSNTSAPLASVQREERGKTVTDNTGKKKPWDVVLKGVRVYGHHTVETNQLKGELDGDIDTDLSLSSKEGLLSVEKGKITVSINSLLNRKGEQIVKRGKIESAFRISPLDYRKERGGEVLKFLAMDSAITAEMENLEIFNTHLQRSRKIQLSGKGALESQIHLSSGKLLPGTKLQIDASKLSVKKRDYLVRGEGKIQLSVTKKNPDTLNGKILFGDFHTYRTKREKKAEGSKKRGLSFFHGKGLTLDSKTSSTLYPKSSAVTPFTYLGLVIPPVTVDDLSLIQQYIPEKWGVEFYRGEGTLQGKADILEEELNATLKLISKDAEIGFGEQRAQSDLDMEIKVKVATTPKLHADLTGTYIELNNTRLSNQKEFDKRESKPWNTKLYIEQGEVMLPLPENSTARRLSAILKRHKAKDIIAGAEGQVKVAGDISELDWINLLMKSSLDFTVSGSGAIDADLLVENGSLSKKSTARIKSKNLQVGLLDYSYSGDGKFVAEKTEGRGADAVIYALDFSNATMKRKGEKEAKIENVVMKLDSVKPQDSKEERTLRLQILSAKVKNVSLYNQYFPKNSPFVFVDGSADLRADILLGSNSAKGYVKLITNGLTMRVDDQTISGRLSVDTKIAGGEPKKMKFDISGSTIILDKAKVTGKEVQYDKDDWGAILKMKKADVVWRKPLQLKSEMALHIKDSRPIVAMMDNKQIQFSFINKLLIVNNLRGDAKINIEDNAITIPYALVKSDEIDIGAKGVIAPTIRNGIIYFGHKSVKAVMEIRDGRKSFNIFNAQQSFDNYVIPSPAPSVKK
ncbi:MAG: hypothetical protein U9R26_01605, partial [Campylobacterota bacterium]|nr:hypothetical protein [Campylobacterota bacterium]